MADNRTKKRIVGDIGENLAERWCREHGYLILERNYLKPWGELDIVARKDDRIHFIEVKTTSCEKRFFPPKPAGSDYHRPEERVDERKQKRMARAVQTYLPERHVSDVTDFQCDLICVYLDRYAQKAKITRLENIILKT